MKVHVVLAYTFSPIDAPADVTVFAVCKNRERAEQHEHALHNTTKGSMFKEIVEMELE